MYNTLQKVKQALESVNNMTPAEYAELDDNAWQLVQDVRDCCRALADRVDVLEILQPVPLMDDAERQEFRKALDSETREALGRAVSTEDMLRGMMDESSAPIEHDSRIMCDNPLDAPSCEPSRL